MFGRRCFLTLMAIGSLAGAPALAAQAPERPHPRGEWRWGRDHWAGQDVQFERRGMTMERRGMRLDRRGMRLERRGMGYRHQRIWHQRMWHQRREVHRFRRWDHGRHFARHGRQRHWDRII